MANNSVPVHDLPALIKSVRSALTENDGQQSAESEKQSLSRPVSVKKSVTPDYLTSMEDGRQYRTLTRHLKTRGLTPQQYREKWGLPSDYPMTAPNYSARRSELAKSLGLGQSRRNKAQESQAKGRRGRKPAA